MRTSFCFMLLYMGVCAYIPMYVCVCIYICVYTYHIHVHVPLKRRRVWQEMRWSDGITLSGHESDQTLGDS